MRIFKYCFCWLGCAHRVWSAVWLFLHELTCCRWMHACPFYSKLFAAKRQVTWREVWVWQIICEPLPPKISFFPKEMFYNKNLSCASWVSVCLIRYLWIREGNSCQLTRCQENCKQSLKWLCMYRSIMLHLRARRVPCSRDMSSLTACGKTDPYSGLVPEGIDIDQEIAVVSSDHFSTWL